MPSYSHDYVAITNESVQVELDWIGGTTTNYAKPRNTPTSLTKVTQAGVDITSSCSITDLGGSIGEVITFGSPSTLTGLVLVTYDHASGSVATEPVQITRHNVGGTKNNYLEVKYYPIKDSSVTLEDGDGNDVTSDITGFDGEGKQLVRVGDLAAGKYIIDYTYDNGEAGLLYRENKDLESDITDLTAFISETNTKYQDAIDKATNERETSKKNLRLWLMRKILEFIPSGSELSDEDTEIDDVQSYWDSNKTSAMNSSTYGTLKTKIDEVIAEIESNGTPTAYSHSPAQNKLITYLAEMAEIDNQVLSFSFDGNSNRYDYDGTSNETALSSDERGYLTDGNKTASNSYSETSDYSLRLTIDNSQYIVGLSITVVPSDDSALDLDDIKLHLGLSSATPVDFIDGSDEDKGVNNAGFKNVFNQEVNRYEIFKYINEALKDSDGAPVTEDSYGNKFDHRIIDRRDGIFIFKKSTRTNNYIANIAIYVPSDDLQHILNYVSSDIDVNERLRVYNRSTEFVSKYNDGGTTRIGAWNPINNKGVSTSGNIGTKDGINYFDASNTNESAWNHVEADIESLIDGDYDYINKSSYISTISTWDSELSSESISLNQKIIEKNYTLWKKKYTTATTSYVSAISAKSKKDVELIEKSQLVDVYDPLPTID